MGTAAAVVGGSVVSSYFTSKSQEKAAKKQAQGIENAQKISEKAARQARKDVLNLFNPAFGDISTSLNQSRQDLLDGRVSSQELLNDAFARSSSTIKTSQQNAMSALLGQSPQESVTPQSSLRTERASRQPVTIDQSSGRVEPITQRGINAMMNMGTPSSLRASQAPVRSQATQTPINQEYLAGMQPGYSQQALRSRFEQDAVNRAAPTETPDYLRDMAQLEGSMNSLPVADYVTPAVQPEGNYGLSGAEDALRAGAQGQMSAINDAALGQERALLTGAQDAINFAGSGFDNARNDLTSQYNTGIGQLRGAVTGGMDDLRSQTQSGLGALRQGINTGRADITSATNKAVEGLDPYNQTGQSALQREAALTGALGPEAQAEAFASYTESPGQAFLREQQEKALTRNSAATGGTGGGRVLAELQRQAAGNAAQNYQQDLNNLRSIAQRGQSAAGTQGGFRMQGGQTLANLAAMGGQAELAARQALGDRLASLRMQGGQSELAARQNLGGQLSNLGVQGGLTQAQIAQGLGSNLANVYGQQGTNIANIIGQESQATSGLRSQAGQQISDILRQGGQQQAANESNLFNQLANIDQQTATNLANLSAQQGQATSGLRTGLASILANIATGQGSQQANLATQLGGARAAGVTNPVGNTLNQLLGMYTASQGALG